jgi:hypothetical protein
VLENDPHGILPFTTRFYFGPPSPIDLLLGALTLAVALDLTLRGRPFRLPEPFTGPLLLLVAAVVAGAVTGYAGGASTQGIVEPIVTLAYLVVLPFLVVNVLTTRAAIRGVAIGGVVLAVYKGFEGSAGWLAGAGRELGGTTLTYYGPPSNFLMLLFILAVAGALLARINLPWWVYAATPLVAAAFTFSFRRNWWIAALLAILLMLFLTSGVPGRRLVLPGTLALAVATWMAVSAGGGVQLEGSVAERARSIVPSRVQRDKFDRYRLDEMRNVRSEVSRHPVTGLGLGIPWTARHAIGVEFDTGRYYTHVVALWYWLKLGLVGLAAYLWLMAAAIYAGFSLWRIEREGLVRVLGLASATAVIGLMVAETTGSFTGVEPRLTVVLGALFGWLAAARQLCRAELQEASAGST